MRKMLFAIGILFLSASAYAQDSLGVAYFPGPDISLAFENYSVNADGTYSFEDYQLFAGDVHEDYISGAFNSSIFPGDFLQASLDSMKLTVTFLSSTNSGVIVYIPATLSTPAGSVVYVFDGNHTVIAADSMVDQGNDVLMSGNVSTSNDASLGGQITYWVNNPNSGIPQAVWDNLLRKGTFSTISTVNGSDLLVECDASTDNCVYVIQ